MLIFYCEFEVVDFYVLNCVVVFFCYYDDVIINNDLVVVLVIYSLVVIIQSLVSILEIFDVIFFFCESIILIFGFSVMVGFIFNVYVEECVFNVNDFFMVIEVNGYNIFLFGRLKNVVGSFKSQLWVFLNFFKNQVVI